MKGLYTEALLRVRYVFEVNRRCRVRREEAREAISLFKVLAFKGRVGVLLFAHITPDQRELSL
jgi:hypothetical protein